MNTILFVIAVLLIAVLCALADKMFPTRPTPSIPEDKPVAAAVKPKRKNKPKKFSPPHI